MTEPSRPSPGTDPTEVEPHEQLDPTRARSQGEFVFATRKPVPEPNFSPPEKDGEIGTLGRYRVLKKLGQGGMGAVYLSYDGVLGRRIALKVVPPRQADAETRERFLREARAAAMVRSDHVVTIYDVGEERGIPFIAMEYLSGHPLDRYLKTSGELPVAQVVRIGRETAIGLAAAHDLGLVHRDVKPGNIWLEAPHGRVKLLDFGLARTIDDDTHLTTSGLVMGTPAFMSPEQARGLKLDPRSDLFSLGVMLYRLATGKMPFSGTTTMAVLTSLAVDVPASVRALNPKLSERLEAVITKLLAKNPADRFQTAWEVAAALSGAEQPGAPADQLPVAVRVIAAPMVVAAQTENVWASIETSEPVTPEPGAESQTAPVRSAGARRAAPPPSKWPALLAFAALALAITGLAAVLLWPANKPAVVEKEPEKPTEKKPAPPVPDTSSDRTAAEFVLARGGEVHIMFGGREHLIRQAGGLPSDRFVLTGFDLSGKQMSDSDMAMFKACRSLTHVALHDTRVGEPGLGIFRGAVQIEHLVLDGSPLTNVSVGFFKGCRDLRFLSLRNTPITDDGAAYYSESKKLTHLHLSGAQVGDKGLSYFRGNKGLLELAMNGTHVTDDALAHFADHAALREVEVAETAVTDAGLIHARNWKQLTFLDLRKTRVTAAGVAALAEKLPLCRIEWDRGVFGPPSPARKIAEYTCNVGGFVRVEVEGVVREIKTAADLPKEPFALVTLNFSFNTKVTDAGLGAAEGCKDLKELVLNDSAVTDAGLAHFANCTGLTRLTLSNTKVTDAGLAHLSGARNLTYLSLDGTSVGKTGLAPFAGHPRLAFLDVRRTNVTAVKTGLAKALPGCRIEWDGGTIEPKK